MTRTLILIVDFNLSIISLFELKKKIVVVIDSSVRLALYFEIIIRFFYLIFNLLII